MESGTRPQISKDFSNHSTELLTKSDDKIVKSVNVPGSVKISETPGDSKKSDLKVKNELTIGSSTTPNLAQKPTDLKLSPVFHVSPLLARHKHKRTKSVDKVSMGSKKSPAGLDLTDSVCCYLSFYHCYITIYLLLSLPMWSFHLTNMITMICIDHFSEFT